MDASPLLRVGALAVVLVVALAFRLYGANWDQGGFFHPDERFILLLKLPEIAPLWPFDLKKALDPAASPWNPHWFAYGSFPFYLMRAAFDLAQGVLGKLPLDDTRFLGRGFSALADTGTVALVYWLGSRLYGWRTGLLGAALLALAVIHIQLSHFAAFDVQLTFWVTCTIAGAALAMRRPGWPSVVVTALGLGLGLATKVSVAELLAPIAVGHALYVFTQPDGALGRRFTGERVQRAVVALAATLALAGVLTVIAQPYALLDLPAFLHDTQEQTQMALRSVDLPYTRQYIGTTPYLYQFQQLSGWGLWWPLGLVAWAGLLLCAVRGLYGLRPADLLLLSWILPYFLFTGAFPVKFLRYMLPVTPLLVLLGARLLVSWQAAAARAAAPSPWHEPSPARPAAVYGVLAPPLAGYRWTSLPTVAIALVLALTALYAVAYTSIYRQPHAAQRMAEWIRGNVRPGTPMLKEHWEEGLPHLEAYPQAELPMYEPDNPAKVDTLARLLATNEYIIFFSNRLYGTVGNLPERYPVSSKYYHLLFNGDLGYQVAHYEASYPQALNLTWVNDTFGRPGLPAVVDPTPPGAAVIQKSFADESFSAYDHPLVILFRNDHTATEAQIRQRLLAFLPAPNKPEGLLMPDDLRTAQQTGGTWSDLFDRGNWANALPVAAWLLVVETLFLLGLPACLWLFRGFPDRGVGLAPMLTLITTGWLVWLAAAVRLLPFGRMSILLVLAVLAAGSGAALWRWRAQALAALRSTWLPVLVAHGVFLLAFGFDLWLRSQNPDLWHPNRGGEKPMDFAYFNAILRSTYMPPYDPWYAGGYLNYYYFGQFLAAIPTKLTGIVPSVAYNLVIPTLFGSLFAGAFSIGGALVSAVHVPAQRLGRAALRPVASLTEWARPWWWLAGITVAMGVAVAGNLDGGAQLVERLQQAGGIKVNSAIPGLSGAIEGGLGIWRVLFNGARLLPLDYWRSRGMGDMDRTFLDPGSTNPSPTIVEFPFFTYLFADLHAHLIALPVAVVALALALRMVQSGERERWWQRGAALGLLGVVLGALRWTNSWDYPTYLLAAAAALAATELWQTRTWLRSLASAVLQVGVVAAASILTFLPFQRWYELFYGGGLVPSPEHTTLALYLRIHGMFLAGIGALVLHQWWGRASRAGLWRTAVLLIDAPDVLVMLGRLRLLAPQAYLQLGIAIWGCLAVAPVWWAIGVVAGGAAPFITLLLAGVAALALLELREQAEGRLYLFVLGIAALALSLTLFVEVGKLDIPGEVQRMNNVFKLYLQVWVLLAVAGAYGFWWVLSRVNTTGRSLTLRAQGWLWCMGLLTAGVLIYPVMATPVRLNDRFYKTDTTLDGDEYLKGAQFQDAQGPVELKWDGAAMQWLEENVVGSPVILEAVTPIYRWGSRVSVNTGLPTVLGWDWHQSQQRWDYRTYIEQRKNDVLRIYSAVDPAQAMPVLRKYGVRYVYLGPLERLYYPAEGLAKFPTMVRQGLLKLAYENPHVSIYEVVG